MVENNYSKWIALVILMSVVPMAYAFAMGYWLLMWMSVVDYVVTAGRETIIGLIVVGNILGVFITANVIVWTLKRFFKQNLHWAALGVAVSIVVWSMITTTLYWKQGPDTITILEWVALLVVIPGFAYLIRNVSFGGSE